MPGTAQHHNAVLAMAPEHSTNPYVFVKTEPRDDTLPARPFVNADGVATRNPASGHGFVKSEPRDNVSITLPSGIKSEPRNTNGASARMQLDVPSTPAVNFTKPLTRSATKKAAQETAMAATAATTGTKREASVEIVVRVPKRQKAGAADAPSIVDPVPAPPNSHGLPHPWGTNTTNVVYYRGIKVGAVRVPLVPLPFGPPSTQPDEGLPAACHFPPQIWRSLDGFTFPADCIITQSDGLHLYGCLELEARRIHAVTNALSAFLTQLFVEMYDDKEWYIPVRTEAQHIAFFEHIKQAHFSMLAYQQSYRKRSKDPSLSFAGLRTCVIIKMVRAVISGRETFLKELAAKKQAASVAVPRVKREPKANDGTKVKIEDSSNIKKEPVGDDVNLGQVTDFDACDWMISYDSDVEEFVPPAEAGENGKAPLRERRKTFKAKCGLALRSSVDRWIRFVRVDLGREEDF